MIAFIWKVIFKITLRLVDALALSMPDIIQSYSLVDLRIGQLMAGSSNRVNKAVVQVKVELYERENCLSINSMLPLTSITLFLTTDPGFFQLKLYNANKPLKCRLNKRPFPFSLIKLCNTGIELAWLKKLLGNNSSFSDTLFRFSHECVCAKSFFRSPVAEQTKDTLFIVILWKAFKC